MKTPILLFFAFSMQFVSCGSSPLPGSYQVKFPERPPFWAEILGENQWRLDYYDSGGNFRQVEITGNAGVSIDILQEWPSAVLAWPCWPEKALAAGLFYPAGAIFPLDCKGKSIVLSWEAGADAYFYRELDKAQSLNTGTNRKPEFFDWKRFRSLLRETVPEELKADPWLADWKDIAERTVRSGFRQSYIRAEARTSTVITIPHSGPWLFASPFRPPEAWLEDEEVNLLLSPRPETLVCPGGRLSVSEYTWIWIPFP